MKKLFRTQAVFLLLSKQRLLLPVCVHGHCVFLICAQHAISSSSFVLYFMLSYGPARLCNSYRYGIDDSPTLMM